MARLSNRTPDRLAHDGEWLHEFSGVPTQIRQPEPLGDERFGVCSRWQFVANMRHGDSLNEARF